MPSRKLTAHCPQCGCKNHLRAAYCNQCGSRLKEQSAAKDDDGRAKLYADIAHPINAACREMIQQRVIKAYEEEKARSRLPGYVPSYEDFDEERLGRRPPADHAVPAHRAIAGGPSVFRRGKVQRSGSAARPTPPAYRRRNGRRATSEVRGNDSFGAGIFE